MSRACGGTCFRTTKRSGLGTRSLKTSWSLGSRLYPGGSDQPSRPVSSPRQAFWKDSIQVRPIAIVSPTLFIMVVSSALLPGNFSKVNRGILVMM